jgi:hypothetical protein
MKREFGYKAIEAKVVKRFFIFFLAIFSLYMIFFLSKCFGHSSIFIEPTRHTHLHRPLTLAECENFGHRLYEWEVDHWLHHIGVSAQL